MGTITSGVGLMSGLNIDDIVTKLMAIERQPVTNLQNRMQQTDSQQAAITGLMAQVLGLKTALVPLKNNSFFRANNVSSSNTSVLQAAANSTASVGTYQFRVQQIATAQQIVSQGVADPNRSNLGSSTVVLASSQARLTQATSLDFLNSQHGVTRGTIRITDGAGQTAEVDLSNAKTVQDVLDAINKTAGVQVRAEVRGDGLAIVDLSGQQTAALTIADVTGTNTAAGLGIAGSSTSGEIVGSDINTISEDTSLALLNDGNGVSVHGKAYDMQLTAADGSTFSVRLGDLADTTTNLSLLNEGLGVRLGVVEVTHADGSTSQVDLTNAKTLGDVQTAFKDSGKLNVTVSGNKLLVSDTALGNTAMSIKDVSGHAAADLGIAGTATVMDPTQAQKMTGEAVYSVRTIGDVLRAINAAAGNDGKITASFAADSKNIVLTDNTSSDGSLSVTALNGSTAAADLGLTSAAANGEITGRRLISDLNGTLLRSLNGGQGITELGQISITDRAGNQSTFDLSGAQTLSDVLSALQAQPGGAQIQAKLSDSGLGIVLEDISGGDGTLTVEDVAGTTAQDLKIAGQSDTNELRGEALYRQYINGNTLLSDMNNGQGIASGSFRITDSMGRVTTINVSNPGSTRLQDLINDINAATNNNVEARINDTGDGIVLVDMAGGGQQLKIEDISSTTAADLRIAGTAPEGGTNQIDGRASIEIDLDATASLNDLVTEINSKAGKLLQASIVNDGTSVTPYRLVLSSANTGTRGAMTIDTGQADLQFSTLVEAQDAIVYYGDNNGVGGVPIVSSDNTLDGIVPGMTLTLSGQGSVSVTISRNTDQVSSQLSSLVDKYNEIITNLDDLTKYDSTTQTAGLLLGDYTAIRLQDVLSQVLSIRAGGSKGKSLTDLGFSVGSNGQISFDQDAFNSAISSNPDGIRTIFTAPANGLWKKLDDLLGGMTDATHGALTLETQTLQGRHDLFSKRIDDMNDLLDIKQRQLYSQFQAMETALAQMQGQQSVLTTLSSMASSMKASSSS